MLLALVFFVFVSGSLSLLSESESESESALLETTAAPRVRLGGSGRELVGADRLSAPSMSRVERRVGFTAMSASSSALNQPAEMSNGLLFVSSCDVLIDQMLMTREKRRQSSREY